LGDEWACPEREPIIGIPFYLADPELTALEQAVNDIEDEREIMMYLRHEAGHAFNYAYELYAPASGTSCSAPSTAPIPTTTSRCPSRAGSCATSPAGTRRSTPTRTSPRRSRSGSRRASTGAAAIRGGRRWPSWSTSTGRPRRSG